MEAITASAKVTRIPSLSSGEKAAPRRMVSMAPICSPVSTRVAVMSGSPGSRKRESAAGAASDFVGWVSCRPIRLDGLAGLFVGVDQPGVRRAALEQLGVRTAVCNAPLLEVHDLVGQPDGGLAVGHHHQSARVFVGGRAGPGTRPGRD